MEAKKPPTEDPAAELSPTARRILAAARQLLSRHGYNGLSLEAIAAAAGENKSSIRYHFGNKAGLIAALADSVVHDENMALRRELSAMKPGDDRVDILVDQHRRTTKNLADYQMFWDLFPHLIRDSTLWPRMAALFGWYRELDSWALAPDAEPALRARLNRLAAITVAVCDGLAMQYAADESLDIDAVFDYWETVIRSELTAILGPVDRGSVEPG